MKKTAPTLKLCVISGSRAEYGLLMPLLRAIQNDPSFSLQLVATGMHLSPEFGLTYRQIEEDGFRIDEKVEILLSSDTDTGTVKSIGLANIGFADAFQRLRPDWVIVLGDRFEIFAAATAAHLMKIPVAHLHGGELTEGATDDAMRHAITKMSYLHFTAAEEYRKRVIRLGEDPGRVFNVGAIGLESIGQLDLLDRSELSRQLDLPIGDNTVVVTFHPVTLEKGTASRQMKNLLAALDQFPDLYILFTMPNADANGRAIMQLIEGYVAGNLARSKAFTSLGQLRYLSALRHVKAVIGNSSSGIIEAPQFRIPTVNIGDRQAGRIRPASVIDVGTDTKNIVAGMRKAFSQSFLNECRNVQNPYAGRNTAKKILQAIRRTGRLSSVKKSFYDPQT